jgi:hypothetical protein
MSKPKVNPTTLTGAKIHSLLTNLRMKVIVTKCVLVAFFIILAFFMCLFLFIKSSWQDKAIVGVLEGILSYTMYPLVTHYLPAKKEAEIAEKRTGGKDV